MEEPTEKKHYHKMRACLLAAAILFVSHLSLFECLAEEVPRQHGPEQDENGDRVPPPPPAGGGGVSALQPDPTKAQVQKLIRDLKVSPQETKKQEEGPSPQDLARTVIENLQKSVRESMEDQRTKAAQEGR